MSCERGSCSESTTFFCRCLICRGKFAKIWCGDRQRAVEKLTAIFDKFAKVTTSACQGIRSLHQNVVETRTKQADLTPTRFYHGRHECAGVWLHALAGAYVQSKTLHAVRQSSGRGDAFSCRGTLVTKPRRICGGTVASPRKCAIMGFGTAIRA